MPMKQFSVAIAWLLLIVNFCSFFVQLVEEERYFIPAGTHTHLVIVLIDVFVQFM